MQFKSHENKQSCKSTAGSRASGLRAEGKEKELFVQENCGRGGRGAERLV